MNKHFHTDLRVGRPGGSPDHGPAPQALKKDQHMPPIPYPQEAKKDRPVDQIFCQSLKTHGAGLSLIYVRDVTPLS